MLRKNVTVNENSIIDTMLSLEFEPKLLHFWAERKKIDVCIIKDPVQTPWYHVLGLLQSVWMLDDLMIGGSLVHSGLLYETFDTEPDPQSWLFWPGATIDTYCSLYTRYLLKDFLCKLLV